MKQWKNIVYIHSHSPEGDTSISLPVECKIVLLKCYEVTLLLILWAIINIIIILVIIIKSYAKYKQKIRNHNKKKHTQFVRER